MRSAIYKTLKRSCQCGAEMHEVLGYFDSPQETEPKVFRKGWYCTGCKLFDKAILRERTVEENKDGD